MTLSTLLSTKTNMNFLNYKSLCKVQETKIISYICYLHEFILKTDFNVINNYILSLQMHWKIFSRYYAPSFANKSSMPLEKIRPLFKDNFQTSFVS